MDWGLGNPNKTAALIATLMVGVWALAYLRRWAFWLVIPISTGLGICLIHTFSRGGVLAGCFGLGILLWKAPRPWPSSRVIALVISLWAMIGASVCLDATKRLGQGVTQEDKSITNRLAIWKTVPSMMVDAPRGWGHGNSGRAYTQWYQPTHRSEEYRTLVSSHLTWLVEFGWILRFLYVSAWIAVLVLCFPGDGRSWMSVPFAVWVTFCVAAFFSSVGESIWIWVVPAIHAVGVIGYRLFSRVWPRWTAILLAPPAGAAGVLAGLALIGIADGGLPISRAKGVTTLGVGQPRIWVLNSASVFGQQPARALRTFWESLPPEKKTAIALAESAGAISSSRDGTLVLGGELKDGDAAKVKELAQRFGRIVLVNPSFPPSEIGGVRAPSQHVKVLFGEFNQSSSAFSWRKYLGTAPTPVEGMGEFVSDWPERAIGGSLVN